MLTDSLSLQSEHHSVGIQTCGPIFNGYFQCCEIVDDEERVGGLITSPAQIMRQFSFAEKMHVLGWTGKDRFLEDEDTLTRCVVRYHHFLDLMASSPGKFAVPTLDIDLAWHTHQLLSLS